MEANLKMGSVKKVSPRKHMKIYFFSDKQQFARLTITEVVNSSRNTDLGGNNLEDLLLQPTSILRLVHADTD